MTESGLEISLLKSWTFCSNKAAIEATDRKVLKKCNVRLSFSGNLMEFPLLNHSQDLQVEINSETAFETVPVHSAIGIFLVKSNTICFISQPRHKK